MNNRYDGTDFSANWKVVTYEGVVVRASWKVATDNRHTFVVATTDRPRPIVGIQNYNLVAQAAAMFGGVPVRE